MCAHGFVSLFIKTFFFSFVDCFSDLKNVRKRKTEKQRAASQAYLDSRKVEIKREAEKKLHDASLPCAFFKKKGFCDFVR